MAFNPILETNIQPTQTVQQPSVANSALGLLGGLFPERKEKPTPSRSDVTDDFRQLTLREMDAAVQDGDMTRLNTAYRNWSTQQGVGTAKEIDDFFASASGRDPMIATSGGDNSVARLRSDPLYGMGFELARSSMPDATPEQLDAEALNYTSSRMSNQARLDSIKQNKDITWAEAQVTYDEGFNLAVKTARSMAAAINADQVITPQEAQEFRNFFATEMEKFDAPPGVDATTWDTYQKQKMGAFNDLINTQLNNLMSDGPSKDMPKAMQNLFDKLVTQGKLPAGIMYAVSGGGNNQAALDTMLQLFSGGQESWAEKITEVSAMSFEELLAYSKTYEETGPEVFENALSAEKISQWNKQPDAAIVGSLVEDRANISSADPMISTLAIQAIVEKVNTLEGKSLDGDLLTRTFDTSFFNALERIKTKNPALGEYFLGRTNEVLKAQQAAMLSNITAVANANGFSATTVNGVADFRPDPKLMSEAAQKEVDTYFGGDWNKAWAANGRITTASSGGGIMGARGGQGGIVLTPNLMRSFGQIKKIKGSLDQYAAVMATVDRLNGVEPKAATNMPIDQNVSTDYGDSSTPEWQAENLTTIQATNGQKWQVNKQAAAAFTGLIAELESMGYAPVSSGGYNYRNIRGSNRLSEHATGNAIDINATANPMGGTANDLPPNISEIAARHGLIWGGDWKGRPDPMHFEFAAGRMGNSSANPPAQGDVADRPFVEATNSFAPMAAAGPMDVPTASPSPAPSVSGTSYQPTQPAAPVAIPQVTNSNPEPTPAAVVSPYDADVQSFLDTVKNGYEAAKTDKSLQFSSAMEVEKAKAEGKIKEGDVVMLKGKPVVVW